ncbi:cpr-c2 [Symbiodinium microadriaticum]|nr:cpr-c2 [Symbiodinium microadriaticum]
MGPGASENIQALRVRITATVTVDPSHELPEVNEALSSLQSLPPTAKDTTLSLAMPRPQTCAEQSGDLAPAMDVSLQRALSGISAVFVIWLVFVAVAFCARKYHPAELLDRNFSSDTDEAAAHQHTESFNAAICAVWGILAGLANLREYEDPYYTLQEMRDAKGPNGTGVNPSLVSGEDVMDAGVLTFQQGSMFDADRTWHFMKGSLYCVAPIVGPGVSTPLRQTYDFWAIGLLLRRCVRLPLWFMGLYPGAGAVGVMASRSRSTQAQANSEGGDTDLSQLPYLYGTAWKETATTDLVVKAVRAGFRGIDTACQPKHYREDLVGAALAKLAAEDQIPREALWIQTKFTSLRGQDPSRVPYDSKAPLAAQVEQSIEKSLQNLGTAYIDSLVMHSPMPSLEENLEVWRVFERAVEQGKVRQLGISNCYDPRTFRRIYDAVRIKPRVLQNRFYVESGYDLELRQFCLERGITYQSFWTLTANPHVLASPPVQSAAERLRATPAQILFRWLIQSGHQPLTGTKSSDHMQQDLEVMSLVLTDGEMQSIGQMFAPGVWPHPIFLKWSRDPRGEVNGLHTMAFRNFLVFAASNLVFDILAVALASARYAFLGRSRAGYEEILNEAPAMPKDLAAHAYAAP